MSWAEVKKINSNMDIPLNSLIGTKVNEYAEDYAEDLNMNYTHDYYVDYSVSLKEKFYDKVWHKNNVIDKIVSSGDMVGVTQSRYTQDKSYGICVGANGLWISNYPFYSTNSPNTSANIYFKLVNLYNGKSKQLFNFGHATNVEGNINTRFYRLSDNELIISAEYYQTTVKTVSTKIIKVDFINDGADATFVTLVDDTTTGYTNISKMTDYTTSCFVSGKYIEVVTSLTATDANNYAECHYLIDLNSKTLVTSDKTTNLVNAPYANVELVKSSYFTTNRYIKIRHTNQSGSNVIIKTTSDKNKLVPSFQKLYIYDNETDMFSMLMIDTNTYYNSNTPLSGIENTPINQAISRIRFKAEYSEEQGKILYSDVSSKTLLGNCVSIKTNHHNSSASYNCEWFNDLNVIRIIGKDAICIPPYFNKGVSGILNDTDSSYTNETYIKYKDGIYTPYIIRNIDGDSPAVEYLNIPWLRKQENWSINECLINNILGVGTTWNCAYSTSSVYKYFPNIFSNEYNTDPKRLRLYSYVYYSGTTKYANNHSGKIQIQYAGSSNTGSGNSNNHNLYGYIMFSKEFNTVDEFLEVFNEFFLMSSRRIPVIKGMKIICDAEDILRMDGVPVSRDEDDSNVFQAEKTGLLKIKMSCVDPDKNSPILLTF